MNVVNVMNRNKIIACLLIVIAVQSQVQTVINTSKNGFASSPGFSSSNIAAAVSVYQVQDNFILAYINSRKTQNTCWISCSFPSDKYIPCIPTKLSVNLSTKITVTATVTATATVTVTATVTAIYSTICQQTILPNLSAIPTTTTTTTAITTPIHTVPTTAIPILTANGHDCIRLF